MGGASDRRDTRNSRTHTLSAPARASRPRSGNKNKTFKPVKDHAVVTRTKLSEYSKATLGSGNMRSAVVLPKGEDVNEWLAGESEWRERANQRASARDHFTQC